MKTHIINLKACCMATVLLFALMHQPAHAQKKYKQYIAPGIAMFLSGMVNGTIESLSFHYDDGFKYRLPGVSDHFWNPSVSWANKYKNGNPAMGERFPGSTSVFVGVTDGYHALRTARNFIDTFTLVYYFDRTRCSSVKLKLKRIIEDAIVLTLIRNVGFYTSYNLMFNPYR